MPEPVALPLLHRDAPQSPRFLADAMLERLARWLRVLGYDVLSAGPGGAEALLARDAASNRILLTRNRAIAAPGPAGGSLLIQHQAPLDQLVEVVGRLDLQPPWRLFTRCLICNTGLLPVVRPDGLPPGTPGERLDHRCPGCDRVYWEGVHTRRMRAALQRALGQGAAVPAGGSLR